jgi:hypothetical protein
VGFAFEEGMVFPRFSFAVCTMMIACYLTLDFSHLVPDLSVVSSFTSFLVIAVVCCIEFPFMTMKNVLVF